MKSAQPELLIIIPAFNEEKNIGAVFDGLEERGVTDYADILVVNDASRDGTSGIVKARGYFVVDCVYNSGYGSALQTGYKFASRRGYRYVIQMDADGQHDPSNVKTIYDALKTLDENGNFPDIVLGSRYMEGSAPFQTSSVKKFAIAYFRLLLKWFGKTDCTDPTSGLQGLSERIVRYYSKFDHFDDRYPDANMILQMAILGANVREIPAVMYQRTEGVSMHSGIKPFIYMFRMTFTMIAVSFRYGILGDDREALRNDG